VKYIAEFFLELEMFRTNVVGKIKAHLFCNIFFPKIVRFEDNVKKFDSTRQTTDGNIIRHRKGAMCVPGNEGKYTETLIQYTDTLTQYKETLAQYLILIGFPREKWLRESISMLLYTTLRVLLISVKMNFHFWIFYDS
jgi:hypothetical protein